VILSIPPRRKACPPYQNGKDRGSGPHHLDDPDKVAQTEEDGQGESDQVGMFLVDELEVLFFLSPGEAHGAGGKGCPKTAGIPVVFIYGGVSFFERNVDLPG